ncbi:hypothetical protein [Brevibacterium permense]|nr:hypothetical protein [Brevibacterium permense]
MNSSITTHVRDAFMLSPAYDFIFVPVGTLVAWLAISTVSLNEPELRWAIYTGLLTISGLSMASVTFARSTLYGAKSDVMGSLRDTFREPLRKNWRSIIRDTFAVSVTGLACFWIDAANSTLAILVAGASLGLLIARVSRALQWMDYSQRIEVVAANDRVTRAPSRPSPQP